MFLDASSLAMQTLETARNMSLALHPALLDDLGLIAALRWEIETLFAAMKTRGFNLEDTHMTNHERVSKLVAVLAIAFCWAHKIGDWLHKTKPIRLKSHERRAKSIFRYGFDQIRRYLLYPPAIRQAFEPIHFLATGPTPIQPLRMRSA